MTQEEFNEQMNTRADKWSSLDKTAVNAGISFAARMCITYPELAKVWYDSIPKITMDGTSKLRNREAWITRAKRELDKTE